jgi:hypothetical protein
MGKETYLMNLKQISEACIETCAYGVIHALLSSRSHYNQWENMFGNGNQVPFADLFKRQKFEFALFQRNPKGAYVLDAQVKDMARDVGVAFDTIVLPPKVAIYLSLCTSWGTEAYRRGAAAMEKALNTAPANYNSFRGSNVHECYKFDEHFENSPICPLTRPRQSGEFYIMPANHTSIKIFDMDTDDWKEIKRPTATASTAPDTATTGNDALDTDYVDKLKANGDVRSAADQAVKDRASSSAPEAAAYDAFSAALRSATSLTADETSALGELTTLKGSDAGAAWTVVEALANAKADADVAAAIAAGGTSIGPIAGDILVVRPWATYNMSSALYCKSGSELGNCFTGHADMMMSSNAISKSHVGHYTFYSKAVVRNEKLMYIAEDIFSDSYVGGDGCREYTKDKLEEDLTSDKCGTREQRADYFCIPLADNTVNNVSNPIDIRNETPPCCKSDTSSTATCFTPKDTAFVDDIKAAISATGEDWPMRKQFHESYHTANTICWRGAYKVNTKANGSGEWVHKHGTGLWGNCTYPGCRAVRDGGFEEMSCGPERRMC